MSTTNLPTWMHIIHVYVTPTHVGDDVSRLWATVVCTGRLWQIRDGWNLGVQSQACTFPNLDCATTYLAGKWQVRQHQVVAG